MLRGLLTGCIVALVLAGCSSNIQNLRKEPIEPGVDK